jgi:phospholipase C
MVIGLTLICACNNRPATDPLIAARAQCTFSGGAKIKDTLGLSAAERAALPIKHIIVLMKENRSFDHVLGNLHAAGQSAVEPIPADFSNKDKTGKVVTPFHAPTTCWSEDPGHQWVAMFVQVDHSMMDGFVASAAASTTTDGHFVMSYYDQHDLPFYYWLANTYALNDRHFPSVRSGTFPNRDFMLLGTAAGVQQTGGGYPPPGTPTIFDALDKAGVSWGVYRDGSLLSGSLNWDYALKNTGHYADFIKALDGGSLPQVSFVDGIDNVEDEHPTADMQYGEAWTRTIYEHAVASRYWQDLAMIWTYDEAGGFFDHVPPPEDFCVARPGDELFTQGGVRVPLAIISPWARPHYVSHVVQEHTAITRFIETIFDLPALTARDANSDALLDLFDFSKPAFANPPAAPAAGVNGCVGIRLTLDQPLYQQGNAIQVSFAGAPGNNPKDKIALYTYPAAGPTQPSATDTLAWTYIGGTQMPSTSPVNGTVTLDMSKLVPNGTWPLPKGGYIIYYLLNDGYTSAASKDLTVQ